MAVCTAITLLLKRKGERRRNREFEIERVSYRHLLSSGMQNLSGIVNELSDIFMFVSPKVICFSKSD